MKFPQELEPTTLVKRYKRFLADVIHPELGEMTAHCPNTGSMKNCWQEGWKAWLLDSQNPKRKYQYTWCIVENDQGDKIGINTHFANEVVFEAINKGKIKEISDIADIKKEVKYGLENSRIDILVTESSGRKVYIEVKSVTLLEQDGQGYFPDAVSTRGQKHIRELIQTVENGDRAILLFLVQHSGIKKVSPAKHIDQKYAELVGEALAKGVEIIAYSTKISSKEIILNNSIPFDNIS
ncbi:MAG: DNA/RNA nuclease SfsA [Kangiellaceae bacterium]|nr:DNA/RNA nuclease SfsA [Kangiellaceae bacterium]MCW9000032.1 DNA/RNA nuclease SfsA [Kangiellaceae bacterium]